MRASRIFSRMRTPDPLARLAFAFYPFSFGLERLMGLLNPRYSDRPLITRRIRGYPSSLRFNPRTYMGRFLDYRGMFEEGVVSRFAGAIRPGDTVLDVGANVGLFTLVASHHVGPFGHVIAVEPQSGVVDLLHENIARNRIRNASVLPVALGRERMQGWLHQRSVNDGEATLRLAAGEASVGTAASVRVVPLDDLLPELTVNRVDVMKIDVEGGESDVLDGARRMLYGNPPRVIILECIDAYLRRFNSSARDVVMTLEGAGYRVSVLTRWGTWRQTTASLLGADFRGDLVAVHSGRMRLGR